MVEASFLVGSARLVVETRGSLSTCFEIGAACVTSDIKFNLTRYDPYIVSLASSLLFPATTPFLYTTLRLYCDEHTDGRTYFYPILTLSQTSRSGTPPMYKIIGDRRAGDGGVGGLRMLIIIGFLITKMRVVLVNGGSMSRAAFKGSFDIQLLMSVLLRLWNRQHRHPLWRKRS